MHHPRSLNRFDRLVILGTHVPRRCGIATFTADLANAIRQAVPKSQVEVMSMSDQVYDYPPGVFADIPVADRRAYSLAAEALNASQTNVLSVQHEYGIFGGPSGIYLLDLLKKVDIPVVTTLHTILRFPTDEQRAILDELIELSTRLVVMSHTARDLLSKVHGVDPRKVDYIPHGIPRIPSTAGQVLRTRLGGSGPILLTFGLLSPDKGIDDVIRALPQLSAEYPDTKYLVVGATHPHIRASMGEQYRHSLLDLATELKVTQHVEFIDDFVPIGQLVEYLSATDFYITPYRNPMQITSGTLAYSMGAGKVVISTPYEYAKEVLADGRGVLVPFRDPEAIASAVLESYSQEEGRREMSLRAREYGSQMYWDLVGQLYVQSFDRAVREFTPRRVTSRSTLETTHLQSEPSLAHLESLTDDTGILQHATFTTANRREGYCLDDNCRALLLTLLLEPQDDSDARLATLQSRYLSFVADALNENSGRSRNFMNFRREWLEDAGSEDSQGRAMWALGETAKRSHCPERAIYASKLFLSAIDSVQESQSPRTWAYLILGSAAMLDDQHSEKSARSLLETMAGRLQRLFIRNSSQDWMWLESRVAYANARIPQAMIKAGHVLNDAKILNMGLASLNWLLARQTSERGDFAPVGSKGAGPSDFGTNQFDQQPIEAASTVSACLTAYRVSDRNHYFAEATRCFGWFLGRNVLGLTMVNSEYGGCFDGLQRDGVNRNQGAESTISYLTAFAELRAASDVRKARGSPGAIISNTTTIPICSSALKAIPS